MINTLAIIQLMISGQNRRNKIPEPSSWSRQN
jgi:hypothetical protein